MEIQTLIQIISSCAGLKNVSGISIIDIAIIVGTSMFIFSIKKDIKKINETKANKKDLISINAMISSKFDSLSANLSDRIDDIYRAIDIISKK
jgi:NAD-dependent SIR2 family protein deacetylase